MTPIKNSLSTFRIVPFLKSALILSLFTAWGNAQAIVNLVLHDGTSARACEVSQIATPDGTGAIEVADANCAADITDDPDATGQVITFTGSGKKCGYTGIKMFPDGTAYVKVASGCVNDDINLGVGHSDGDKWTDRQEYFNGTDPNMTDSWISIAVFDRFLDGGGKVTGNARSCFAKTLAIDNAGDVSIVNPVNNEILGWDKCVVNAQDTGTWGKQETITTTSPTCTLQKVTTFSGGNSVVEVSPNCITDDGVTATLDEDLDGLENLFEFLAGLDPLNSHTAGNNGISDAAWDTDGDGLGNLAEIENGSDPLDVNDLYQQPPADCVIVEDSGLPSELVVIRDLAYETGQHSCDSFGTIYSEGIVNVNPGADLALRAPVVVLKPGFSVASGGALSVSQ